MSVTLTRTCTTASSCSASWVLAYDDALSCDDVLTHSLAINTFLTEKLTNENILINVGATGERSKRNNLQQMASFLKARFNIICEDGIADGISRSCFFLFLPTASLC